MRVAMLHWAFPPVIGGVETHLALLGPELVERGWEVFLLTNSVEGMADDYTWKGMEINRTPLMDLNSLSLVKIEVMADKIREKIYRFIEKVKPDLIHAHNMHYFSPVHAEVLFDIKRKMGIPLILTAHNVWEDQLWDQMCQLAGDWDAVIAVSHYIKEELIKAGYPADRIFTIHHGIDIDRFRPPTREEQEEILRVNPHFAGRRVIFHPARMSLDKGCHIGVRALALIVREFPEVLLVMAGTTKTVDWGNHQPHHVHRITAMVEELGLQNNVWVKFFPWEEMPRMYQASEIVIYPSCFQEPFGLVMLEAQATARPIIVSRAGGMPEVIKHGENGFVVEMNDHGQLAENCLYLLRNPELGRQIGSRGRTLVEKYYTKEIMTEKTSEVYKAVC
ncbi:glycosyltransferase family 4 protein [Calderihabitans maritimus]|uniref:Glycosyltransferase n=1 Tax=Calderihabitans maritimus TaxID=1246530 RepID=A0A1Z5HS33_9FIRM|nr:glycosyltransferase family 4 protein [Calderihabitans maritimus]GAW92090.1 glycosyltransferase [Calderihabitans maritimus]